MMVKKPRAVELAELVVRYRGPILFNDLTLKNQVKTANASMTHEIAQDILDMWNSIEGSNETPKHQHQWFSTGDMAREGRMRCMACGMWGDLPKPVEQKPASKA
jgi:hypothetical protein